MPEKAAHALLEAGGRINILLTYAYLETLGQAVAVLVGKAGSRSCRRPTGVSLVGSRSECAFQVQKRHASECPAEGLRSLK